MMKTIKALFILALLLCSVAHAAVDDTRIQQVIYGKKNVYPIRAQVGRTVLIQFEEGETLESSHSTILGMGDAAAWNLSARGSSIVFKPTAVKPQTNLVIVTNKRSYIFDLDMVKKGEQPTYFMYFDYPDTDKARADQLAERAKLTAAAKSEKIIPNTDYVWRGSNVLLKPTAAWDDGRFTRLMYDSAIETPVFFKLLPDGTEAQINTSIDPVERNTIILQEVIRTVRARLGKEVIEIVNNNYQLPKFNRLGAGVSGAVRIEKGVQQ
jgi:type IV secretion system protein VirB9